MQMFTIVLLNLLGVSLQVLGQEVVVPEMGIVILDTGRIEIENRKGEKRVIEQMSESSRDEIVVLKSGETVSTSSDTVGDLMIPDVASVRLQSDSKVRLPAKEEGVSKAGNLSSLELLRGKLFLNVDGKKLKASGGKQFRLKTPSSILAVKGTHFFTELGEDYETFGVHEGEVSVQEIDSQKVADVGQGNAVMAKKGELSRLRRLTREEQDQSAIYSDFALNFDVSKDSAWSLGVAEKPDLVSFSHDKMLNGEKTAKIAFGAFDGAIDKLPQTSFFLRPELPVMKSSSVPVALKFSVRCKGIRKFGMVGVILKIRDVKYDVQSTFKIPEETPDDKWTSFVVPFSIYEGFFNDEAIGGLQFRADSIEIKPDLPVYSLEFSPVAIIYR